MKAKQTFQTHKNWKNPLTGPAGTVKGALGRREIASAGTE